MNDLQFGYVKILSGVSSGRIGRYVSDERDSGKAKINFGYQTDALSFQSYRNCKILSKASITNDISKLDLIERHFAIVRELESVDLKSNRKIRKHSAEHTEIITECNIIRGLLRERFSPALLQKRNARENVLMFCSFFDVVWLNDFALSWEEKGFHVAWDDHETWFADRAGCLKDILDNCSTFIFVVSKHSSKEPWLKEEYHYLKSIINAGTHRIFCVKADDAPAPAYIDGAVDLHSQFSDEYYRQIAMLIESTDL